MDRIEQDIIFPSSFYPVHPAHPEKKICILILCILGLLVGCQEPSHPQPHTTTFTGNAMTIDYKVIIGQPVEIQHTQILIEDIFHEVNLIYNKWNPSSELSYINEMPAAVQHRLSPGLYRLLQQTDHIVSLTQGRFDPTIASLHDLWKSKLERGETPSKKEIAAIAPEVGWSHIHFIDGIFTKDSDGIKLDLGGIAKGLCVDILLERLNAQGYSDVYVEWGGEIRVSGHHPAGRPWTIYISRLGDTDPAHAIATIPLQDQAIATSGDYMQYWTVQDRLGKTTTYSHIIDPRNGTPLVVNPGSIASASVVAETCALADALATAAMLFDTAKDAQEWLEKIKKDHPSLSFWILTR